MAYKYKTKTILSMEGVAKFCEKSGNPIIKKNRDDFLKLIDEAGKRMLDIVRQRFHPPPPPHDAAQESGLAQGEARVENADGNPGVVPRVAELGNVVMPPQVLDGLRTMTQSTLALDAAAKQTCASMRQMHELQANGMRLRERETEQILTAEKRLAMEREALAVRKAKLDEDDLQRMARRLELLTRIARVERYGLVQDGGGAVVFLGGAAAERFVCAG